MFFLGFILRNLVRQPVHAGLTLLGLSVGIATVVGLGAITSGVERSALLTIQAGDADFVVAQRTSAGLMFSSMTEEDWHRIEGRDGIELATGAVVFISRVGRDPYFRTIGLEPEQLSEVAPPLVEGRYLDPDAPSETVLGDRAADSLDVGIGGSVQVGRSTFTVVGIFRTGNRWLDGGAIAPMESVQPLAAKPGLVTLIYVRVEEAAGKVEIATAIREDFPHLTTISNLDEFEEVDQGLRIMSASNLAVSIMAVGLGALGVMSTMARSVFERTRELGVLRAVGWRARHILTLVVGESLVLCAVGMIVGSIIGVAGTAAAGAMSESIRSLVAPTYDAMLFVRAAGIALAVALAGALYPAIRAVRLQPVEALRSE